MAVAWLAWATIPVPAPIAALTVPTAALQGGTLFAIQSAPLKPKLVTVDPQSGTQGTVADLSTLANAPVVGPLVASSQSSLMYAVGSYCSGGLCPCPRGCNGVPASEIVTINPHTAAVQVSPALASPVFGGIAVDPATQTLWALTPPPPGYPGTNPSIAILRVDPTTGVETTVATHTGEVDTVDSWVALDPASHVLYVATLNAITGAGQLLALDISTNTLSAGLSLATPVSGLVYDTSSATLFGVTTGTPEQLAKIDPATGTETAVATFGAGIKVVGIAIDSASHSVFGVEYNTVTVVGDEIVTVNDQTGATSVGALTPPPLGSLAFAPLPGPPTVGSVAPNSGRPTGGASVTITGTNFIGVTAVKFGTTPAASYTVNSATQITATSPVGTGGVDVSVAAAGGTNAASSADQFTYVLGDVFTAVTPVRLLDTRNGGTLGSGGSLNLTIRGATFGSLTVPANASAVILNVTTTNGSTAGFFTVYPTGVTRPLASNLNWAAHETVPNLVSVGLGAGGAITIYNGVGSADAVVDLEGYYTPPSGSTAGELVAVVPARITDTRAASGQANAGMTLGAGATLDVQVTSMGGIPTGVSAVVMNVTATSTTSAGFFTAYPTGVTRPLASNLNWAAGVTVPNRVIVPVGTGGNVSFYNGVGSADLIVDVSGYFTGTSASGSTFLPLTPTRIVDTRFGTGGFNSPLGQAPPMVVTVAGNGGVPNMTAATPPTAVVLNVTVTGATAASDLAVWPHGGSRPVASDLNFAAAQTVPNLVIVKLSALGQIDIGNDFGSTDVIVDVVGWYG